MSPTPGRTWLNQVAPPQSIGSPIAGSTIEDVNSALADPAQRDLADRHHGRRCGVLAASGADGQHPWAIFCGVLGAGGNFLGGLQSGQIMGQFQKGLAGTNPSGSSSTRLRLMCDPVSAGIATAVGAAASLAGT